MRLLTVLLAVAASAAPALAQPVAPGRACTFDECAIRVEPSFFSGAVILQGPPGREARLGSVGLFGGGLADVVEGVPLALDHAEAAQRSTIGAAVTALGSVLVLSVVTSRLYDDVPSGSDTALLAGGLGLSIASGVLTLQAARRQSRAVWEYNRAVAGQ